MHPLRCVTAALAARATLRRVNALTASALLVGTASTLLLAGCGKASPKAVPDVTGRQLDAAEASLDGLGLRHSVVGGGSFGVAVRSNWQVCEQHPSPGITASEVKLVVARSCDLVPPSSRSAVVPDVEYEALDEAEEQLIAAGLGWDVEAQGRIVGRSRWQVCDQDPEPGQWADTVELYVARSCDERWG
jgi:beta-lactam-binding protein with PASTA domain